MLQENGFFGLRAFFSKYFECAIVKDVAVLINFKEGRSLVLWLRNSICCRCFGSRSILRAIKLASAPIASASGLKG